MCRRVLLGLLSPHHCRLGFSTSCKDNYVGGMASLSKAPSMAPRTDKCSGNVGRMYRGTLGLNKGNLEIRVMENGEIPAQLRSGPFSVLRGRSLWHVSCLISCGTAVPSGEDMRLEQ